MGDISIVLTEPYTICIFREFIAMQAPVHVEGSIVSYATLMVYLDLEQSNDARLAVAGDLAERFAARVIGVAAQARTETEDSLAVIDQQLRQAEECFREALQGRASELIWRSSIEDPVPYIARVCRAADLLVIGKTSPGDGQEQAAQIKPGDLIRRAGRPLLFVPRHIETLHAKRILIGWKDTREAQRSALDALPLLRKSQHVIVCEIDEGHDITAAQTHVDDVVTWLAAHGVNAVGRVEPISAGAAVQLEAIAKKEAIDLIVAGAIRHARFREWFLGGVTRDLLARSSCCQLLAY